LIALTYLIDANDADKTIVSIVKVHKGIEIFQSRLLCLDERVRYMAILALRNMYNNRIGLMKEMIKRNVIEDIVSCILNFT
jgi:hypothetical protein